jgi:FkbM family methyltransferase
MLKGEGKHMSITRIYKDWRYRRLAGGIRPLYFNNAELQRDGYSSQCGQDKWLVEVVFGGMRNGVFVDIGAHDGVSFSNTYFLEKQLDWDGVAIEPMPEVFARLDSNRECVKLNGCVAANAGPAGFLKISGYSEMLSGLVAQYDPRHLERIRREVSVNGGTVEEIEVQCFRLDSVLQEYGLKEINYMNVDVEGAEYDILRSIDFGAVNIRVCGIENNYRDFRIPRLMRDNGYTFVAIVGDEFYVKRGTSDAVG